MFTLLHELLSTLLDKKYYVRYLMHAPCLLLVFLNYGSPTFHGKGPRPLLWAGSRAAHGKITVNKWYI
jgi:hypothetical protein